MKLLLVVLSLLGLGHVQGNALPRYTKAITKLDQLKQLALEGRIIGGNQAHLGQFPWQAAVFFETESGTYFCGGSLISDQWVLTAAHCVSGGRSFTIRLGTTYSSGGDENTVQTIGGEYAIAHENYGEGGHITNDVGVIKLAQSASLNDVVRTIELDGGYVDGGNGLQVSGYGSVADVNGGNTRLNYVDVHSISNDECRSVYGDGIIDSVLCTKGDTNQGSCSGDSGGPLIRYDNGNPRQVGVVSFGAVACEAGLPSGFSRITSFRQWIRDRTGV